MAKCIECEDEALELSNFCVRHQPKSSMDLLGCRLVESACVDVATPSDGSTGGGPCLKPDEKDI